MSSITVNVSLSSLDSEHNEEDVAEVNNLYREIKTQKISRSSLAPEYQDTK